MKSEVCNVESWASVKRLGVMSWLKDVGGHPLTAGELTAGLVPGSIPGLIVITDLAKELWRALWLFESH